MVKDISNGPEADAAFATRALAALPVAKPSAVLENRILADFDAVAAKRKRAPWQVATRWVRRFGDAVWPGAPAWQPVTILALSLLLGLAAGTQVPASAVTTSETSNQTLTLDAAPVLELSGDT